VFAPSERPSPLEALAHPLFDELRREESYKKYKQLSLFEFSEGTKEKNKKTCNICIHLCLFFTLQTKIEEKRLFSKQIE